MLLKRQHTDGRCTGVTVMHTGRAPEQNFSRRLVMQAVAEGWMTIDKATIVISNDGDPLRYALKRKPGYYVKSSGQRIPISDLAWERMLTTGTGDASRREALAFLATKGLPETDYEVTMAYECVLDAEQHTKYRKEA